VLFAPSFVPENFRFSPLPILCLLLILDRHFPIKIRWGALFKSK
jgi:hypothetical protein